MSYSYHEKSEASKLRVWFRSKLLESCVEFEMCTRLVVLVRRRNVPVSMRGLRR